MRNNRSDEVVKKAGNIKSSDKFALVWSITTIIISILISGIILFAVNAADVPGLSFLKNKISGFISGVKVSPGFSLLGGRQNILLLGVDSNGNEADPFKGARSDTIIVFNIDPLSKSVNAISIPRDSKVYLADNYGVDKINAAHALGGPKLTVKTIEENFGIKINHYVAIDYHGVKELVEALGGVPVNVEKRMRYTDWSGGLHINLHPGYQTLNPEQAEGYLRFRHDAIGDIGRMQRQQWFIRGIVKKMQSPDIIVRVPQLIQLASKYIRTDMNFYELSQFAAFAKSVNLGEVQAATLPGKPSRYGRISYWILNTEESQNIIDRLIYREDANKKLDDEKITISLLYSRGLEYKLDEIKGILGELGYEVSCSHATRDPHNQIIAHSRYAGFKNAQTFRQKLPGFENAQFIVSPNNYLCGESDYTLVVSNN